MKWIILSAVTLMVTGLLLCACSDKLDVLRAYDFSLTTMPVQKRIKQGETAEIRCQLNKSGNYQGAQFTLGYFQPDGKGTLKLDDGTVLLPNDTYPLGRSEFRLYYTSGCSDAQAIDLTVRDNFGQRYDLGLSFQNETEQPTN